MFLTSDVFGVYMQFLFTNADDRVINIIQYSSTHDYCTIINNFVIQQPMVVISVKKTRMVVQKLSALREWSVWMCQLLVWGLCVEHALMDILEMERSVLVGAISIVDLKNRDLVNDSWLRFGVAADSHYPRQRCAGSLTPVLVGINCLTLSLGTALLAAILFHVTVIQ